MHHFYLIRSTVAAKQELNIKCLWLLNVPYVDAGIRLVGEVTKTPGTPEVQASAAKMRLFLLYFKLIDDTLKSSFTLTCALLSKRLNYTHIVPPLTDLCDTCFYFAMYFIKNRTNTMNNRWELLMLSVSKFLNEIYLLLWRDVRCEGAWWGLLWAPVQRRDTRLACYLWLVYPVAKETAGREPAGDRSWPQTATD